MLALANTAMNKQRLVQLLRQLATEEDV